MPDRYIDQNPPVAHQGACKGGFFHGGALRALALLMPLIAVLLGAAGPAAAQTRSLKIHYTHTGERDEVVFKRNGRYDQRGLQRLNHLLRDWRRNEPTRMDPRLFDLVWEVYRRSGAKDYIHVVSAYRAPATNNMLRSRSSGVAKNSQHTLGKAMDFFIPGVKLSTLRATAMQMQIGGVGYYPRSGSPFVHLDVGGVRAWPRMSRQELVQIFPKGNTLHIPADGKPLPGYEQALAEYKKRVGGGGAIAVASTAAAVRDEAPAARKRSGNLLAMLFRGGGADEEEDNAEVAAPPARPARAVAQRPAPAPARERDVVAPVEIAAAAPVVAAPVPLARPAFRASAASGGLATALYSPARNAAQDAIAQQAAVQPAVPVEQFADLSQYRVPVPTLLGPRGMRADAQTEVASLATASVTASPAALVNEAVAVPVPAARPAISSTQSQQQLTPAMVAALERSVTADVEPEQAPTQVAALGFVGNAPRPLARPVAAAIAAPLPRPAQDAAPQAATRQFGDGFDMPRTVAVPAARAVSAPVAPAKPQPQANVAPQQFASVSGKAAKGARNGVQSPVAWVLTGDALAKWAINNRRAESAVSMKAPRVVRRTLNADDSAYAADSGFRPVSATASAMDPGRFNVRVN